MVFFRVSDEELETMLQECSLRGAKSVSDLARLAVRRLLSSSHGTAEQQIAECLPVLLKTMTEVQQTIQELCAARITEKETS